MNRRTEVKKQETEKTDLMDERSTDGFWGGKKNLEERRQKMDEEEKKLNEMKIKSEGD